MLGYHVKPVPNKYSQLLGTPATAQKRMKVMQQHTHPNKLYPAAGYVLRNVLYQVFSALSTLPSHSFRNFPGDNSTTIYRLLDSCAQCAMVLPFLTYFLCEYFDQFSSNRITSKISIEMTNCPADSCGCFNRVIPNGGHVSVLSSCCRLSDGRTCYTDNVA